MQLSTNDATTNKPFGEIAEGFDMAEFDDTTITGAIETIIAYAKETFDCPVAFYSGSYCEKENYPEMVDLLLQIQEKWGIGVIDMFNNEEMTAIYGTEQYEAYMSDEVHPTRAGYVEWWTPVIEIRRQSGWQEWELVSLIRKKYAGSDDSKRDVSAQTGEKARGRLTRAEVCQPIEVKT